MTSADRLVLINPVGEQQPLHHLDKVSGQEIALHWEGVGPRLGSTRAWVSLIRIAPGNVSTFHLHPTNDEFFVVVEGHGIVREGPLDDPTEHAIEQYHIIFAPQGVAKQIVNTGSGPLVLVQVYAPAPDAFELEEMLRNEDLAVHLDGRS